MHASGGEVHDAGRMSIHPSKSAADLNAWLAAAAFVGLRWESPFTPCTGITAVFKQERVRFAGRAVFVAPWFPRMAAARKAIESGAVVEVVGADFEIALGGAVLPVQVLCTTDALAPIVYLHLPGDERAFAGSHTPYDTPHAKRDAFLFALAVERLLLRHAPSAGLDGPFIWAADWQCVPAMAREHQRRVTCLHLHNLYDEYLGGEARTLGYDHAPIFEGRSVLSAGFATADVVATVSRGFAEGVRRELLHTAIFAPHLQSEAYRIEAVENANFVELDARALKLAEALRADVAQGAARLAEAKEAARKKLPIRLRKKVGDKTLVVAMGRSATQKLHGVVVEAALRILKTELGARVFFVFATTASDRDDEVRQEVIAALAERHPDAVAFCPGRISFFAELMHAADLNVMASLWEPFGGAYEGTVLPVARAVDGLASQVRPLAPSPIVTEWVHPNPALPPTGWLFREPAEGSAQADLTSLLTSAVPSIRNATYAGMVDACTETLAAAIALHRQNPLQFAEMVGNALELQRGRSWSSYERMLELAAVARKKRGA